MRALARRLYRRSRADRWSSLFGQVAVYSFVVTAITGVFLLFYYKPSMTQVSYHGSYRKLDGVPMSQAYRSTLDISFDVRGGLLMRQLHHGAALLFIAAVCAHALLHRRSRPVITPVSVVMFWFTGATLALLGAFAQVNPVWLFGPSQPGSISAGSVPGWYMGFLDGALRIMPGWEVSVFGHPLTLAVLVPGVLVPGAFFTLLAAYPLLDRRLTGDPPAGRFLDRPRDAATRTGIGAAGITFYGLLWAAAANDQIAYHLSMPLYAVTWFFRVDVLDGPVLG